MELTRISAAAHTVGSAMSFGPSVSASRPAAAVPVQSQPVVDTSAARSPRIDIRVDRGSDGVQTVTVVDVMTGEPLYQVPAPQVLGVLDAAIEHMKKERARDQ